MSCRFLANANSYLAKCGELLTNYGGCAFLVFMLISVYYVGLDIACYSTQEAEDCEFLSKFAVAIVIEILLNLFLFQYFSRHNCVSHWQRQACVAGLYRNAVSIGTTLSPFDGDWLLRSQTSTNYPICMRYTQLTDELDLTDDEEIDSAYLSRFCDTCNRDAPIRQVFMLFFYRRRSHHCPICKICVLRKDHHCFITGACVGLGNQRYFITFLFWACVGLILGARYTFLYLYQTSTDGSELIIIVVSEEFNCSFPLGFAYCIGPLAVVRWLVGYTNFLHAFICTVFSFMLASIVAAGAFFCMQIYYTCYGYTMYEYHSSVRDAFDGDGVTLGERFRLIFGRYWLLNFVFPLWWNPQLLTIEIATNLFRVRSKQL
ncbi:unnamed protein product [Nippostrongylus brasiliensis]|uniref:Palmitoyltransferase n=1 Tax=Nippostrongylus brasiliensis TaxID=27835 RepID=A0A0N4Y984_NIPBR|nr:unnamed protein product [Nippostrongylus brasiliensis]